MFKTLKRFIQQLSEEIAEIRFSAASLAFSTLFSLIPFLVIILAMFQSIGGLEQLYQQAELVILGSLKEATGATVTNYLKATLNSVQSKTLGITGVLFLLFSLMGLFRNIDTAFHRIWRFKPKKPFVRRMWLHSLVMISLPIIMAIFIGLRSMDIISPLSPKIEHKFWFVTSVSLLLWVLYVVVPDTKVHKWWALLSSVLASLGIMGVQSSFLWISLRLFKQNKIFGSLASFPIFLMWLLVIWFIILAGVSLCAFLTRQKPTNKS